MTQRPDGADLRIGRRRAGDLRAIANGLDVREVGKHYRLAGKFIRGVNRVTLHVARGEIVALSGPSGSGKTTLLQLAAGFLSPTDGTVSFDGTEISSLPQSELARFRDHSVGYVSQRFTLIPSLPTVDNAAMPLVALGSRLDAARKRAVPLLDRMGMGRRLAHPPDYLSGGERQRVALVRALVHDPELLLVDGPTSNLDDELGSRVLELLAEMCRERNLAVLLVTNDRAAANVVDRTEVMSEGRLLSNPPSTLKPVT